jgi:hypothetical protein
MEIALRPGQRVKLTWQFGPGSEISQARLESVEIAVGIECAEVHRDRNNAGLDYVVLNIPDGTSVTREG